MAAGALVAVVALTGLAACSPLDGIRQSTAERMLDEAIGDAGTAAVRYEDRVGAGVACSASADLSTVDAGVVTALATALAAIESDDVLPGCDLPLGIWFGDSRLRMSIDAVTATRIDASQW